MINSASHPFEGITPVVCADELGQVVFERKNTDEMDRFLVDFGFSQAGASGDSQYFGGFGKQPYSVEVIKADRDHFVGFSLLASSEEDLDRLASATGLEPTRRDKPGGGRFIILTDPAGFQVEFVSGMDRVAPRIPRTAILQCNTPWVKERVNATVRSPQAPSPVRGMGHLVLQVPNFEEVVRWYMEKFGLIPSDLLRTGGKTNSFALGFFRLNRGQLPADHHTVAILAGPAPKMLHVSTETIDMDAIGQGQQYLLSKGWNHFWGMGRHLLGSQLFDYWLDPAGDEWEHYADGDMMTEDYEVGIHELDRGGLWAWGNDLPGSMRPPGPAPAEAPQEVQDLVSAMLKKPRPWLD